MKRSNTLLIIGLIIILISAPYIAWQIFHSTPGKAVIIEIPKGTGMMQIASILKASRVLPNRWPFILYSVITQGPTMKAGEYELREGFSPADAASILREGKMLIRKITFPEGIIFNQIVDRMAELHISGADKAKELFKNPEILTKFGIAADTLEGYCFPDTYYYIKSTTASEIITHSIEKTFNLWKESWSKSAGFMSLHTLLMFASIVEKETALASERPRIAAVFLNRLAAGIPLQSDPTVIYGLKKFKGLLTKADLRIPTPYNTYIDKDLPPGPICSPSRGSVEAVLHPIPTDELYFVAKGDGSHVFSRTYPEHLKMVSRYQKGNH